MCKLQYLKLINALKRRLSLLIEMGQYFRFSTVKQKKLKHLDIKKARMTKGQRAFQAV